MRTIDSYLKEARICWIIAGIFTGIAIIGHILVLVLSIASWRFV